MIPFLIAAAAIAMFGPPEKSEPQDAACADTIYVVIYRSVNYDQPIPVVVDDSVHYYAPGVKP